MLLRFVVLLLAGLPWLSACAATPAARAPLGASPWLSGALAGEGPPAAWQDEQPEAETSGGSVLYGVLLYIPNRILDVFDVVRARVRLGPGVAFDARATEYADFFAGTYGTVYVGLPGPRGRVLPRLPVGLESRTGIEVSVADATLEGPIGPDYGEFEFGLGLQVLLVGVDVGVEPVELVDLVLGFFTVDIENDDF